MMFSRSILRLLGIFAAFAPDSIPGAPSIPSVPLSPVVLPQVAPDEVGLSSAVLERINAECKKGIEEGLVPGCVVCVGRHGKIAWLRAYGDRWLASTGRPARPMTVDTVFDVASITKPVAVATSIMLLVDQGKLNVDDKVARYLVEYKTPEKESITIRHLLTHTSGFGVRAPGTQPTVPALRPGAPLSPPAELPASPRDEVERLLALQPGAAPGEVCFYAGANMDTLAILLERVTGRDIATYARENIFQPLGMLDTGYLPGAKLRERAAPTRLDGRDTGRVRDPYTVWKGGVSGGAGLFSTAGDLAVYAAMMLNHGRLPDHTGHATRILSPETIRLITARGAGAASGRGLGWEMGPAYIKKMSGLSYGHGGFDGIWMQMDPTRDLFVIFLSNRMHAKKGAAKASRIPVYQLAGRVGDIAVDAIVFPRPASATN